MLDKYFLINEQMKVAIVVLALRWPLFYYCIINDGLGLLLAVYS